MKSCFTVQSNVYDGEELLSAQTGFGSTVRRQQLGFVPPLRVFLPARFRLHAQRDECYVHVMTRSRSALAALKSVDIGRRSLPKRVGVSKSVKKCVTRVRKVQEGGGKKSEREAVTQRRPALPRNSIRA